MIGMEGGVGRLLEADFVLLTGEGGALNHRAAVPKTRDSFENNDGSGWTAGGDSSEMGETTTTCRYLYYWKSEFELSLPFDTFVHGTHTHRVSPFTENPYS
jgi:hypothetical protein